MRSPLISFRRGLRRLPRTRFALFALVTAMLIGSAGSGAVILIGRQDNDDILVPTNQTLHGAGTVTTLDQRPVDMVLRPNGKQIAVMTTNYTYLLDAATGKMTQQLDKADRNYAGLAYSPDGTRLYYAKGKTQRIGVATLNDDGKATFDRDIDSGKDTWPAGLSVSPDGKSLFVALFGTNQMGIVDLQAGTMTKTVPVGSSPFGAYVSPDGGTVFVPNWGGDLPKQGDTVDPYFPVKVDARTGAAAGGSMSVYDVASGQVVGSLPTGSHPTAVTFDKDSTRLFVANANEDTVSVFDITATNMNRATAREVERIPVQPHGLPFGSMPNGLALSADGGTLYVANGGNNAIAVVALSDAAKPHGDVNAVANSGVRGFIPVEWYPIAVLPSADGKTLYIANNKGEGSLGLPTSATVASSGGKSVFNLTGSVSFVPVPDDAKLADYTAQVDANSRYAASLADSLQPPRPDAAPVPVPARVGEPSVFKHVVYIIKENRTYDQIFGDMGKGNSEPKLAQFPRNVSPNHHALADRFGLLDNYYASSVNSADGHQWTDEAVANVFAERVYGFYPTNSPTGITSYGDSSLDQPPDSLFSNALAHGVSLRNYGEDAANSVKTRDGQEVKRLNWSDIYNDWKNKTGQFTITATPAIIPPLAQNQDRAYPAFDPLITDQIRADEWSREFDGYVAGGNLPALSVVWLPNDHTSGALGGAPTPKAQVADNDLALGRVVDRISHSPYWKDTAIFVTEDDAQNGVDHVDGHRTVGMIISAYNKTGTVDSTLLNQTSMVRTIEQILGLPPMNQFDLTASLMTGLFGDAPDLTPYTVLPNQIPLDQLNGQPNQRVGQGQKDAQLSATLDFHHADATDPAVLNAIIWRATMGDTPYPHFAWEKNLGTRRDDD